MDNFIVMAVRTFAQVAAHIGAWSIRLGEWVKAWQQHRPLPINSTSKGATGVPATVLASVAPTPLAHMDAPTSIATPATSPLVSPAISIALQAVSNEPEAPSNELDWAGSLNHAAVAGLHLSNALAMVRAGWLIPNEAYSANVSAALDTMEIFMDRTMAAVAPVLAVMSDDQRAGFFADFGADFPPDLPNLENEETQ